MHSDAVLDVMYAMEGKLVLSISDDMTANFWLRSSGIYVIATNVSFSFKIICYFHRICCSN